MKFALGYMKGGKSIATGKNELMSNSDISSRIPLSFVGVTESWQAGSLRNGCCARLQLFGSVLRLGTARKQVKRTDELD